MIKHRNPLPWLAVTILMLLPLAAAQGQDPSCLDAPDGTPNDAVCVVDDAVEDFVETDTGIFVEGGSGDVDGNGVHNFIDVSLIINQLNGNLLTHAEYARADINGDGRVSQDDLGLAILLFQGAAKDAAVASIESGYGMTASNVFYFKSGVRVGVGTTNPGYTLDVNGSLHVNGPIYQRGLVLHADYVFEPDYELESIEDHAEQMWQDRHLPAVPPRQVDAEGREVLELGAHRRGLLEELEKAHIYIAQLDDKVQRQEKELAELRAAVARLVADGRASADD